MRLYLRRRFHPDQLRRFHFRQQRPLHRRLRNYKHYHRWLYRNDRRYYLETVMLKGYFLIQNSGHLHHCCSNRNLLLNRRLYRNLQMNSTDTRLRHHRHHRQM